MVDSMPRPSRYHSEVELFTVKRLIEAVQRNPVLYDTSKKYVQRALKDTVWANIAIEIGGDNSGEDLKKKWRNIRDAYKIHVKSNNTNSNRLRNYIWAKYLKFLDSTLGFKRLHHTIEGFDSTPEKAHLENDFESFNVQTHSPIEPACELSLNTIEEIDLLVEEESLENNIKSRNEKLHSPVKQVLDPTHEQMLNRNEECNLTSVEEYLDNNVKSRAELSLSSDEQDVELDSLYENLQNTISDNAKQNSSIRDVNYSHIKTKELDWLDNKHLDQIDNLFLYYADTFKKLMPKQQISIKLKLAKAFHEAELKNLEKCT